MKLKPVNGHIIGKWLEKEQEGLIVLNNQKREELLVLAVSDDVKDICIDDRVLVSKYSTNALEHKDEVYVILKASEVVAIFTKYHDS